MSHDQQAVGRSAAMQDRRSLVLVLTLTIGILVVELMGGILTSSLALAADAGHGPR